jgi:putative hydrolase of the HAD superfamily
MTIRCVTFDLDDTLWETGPVIAEAERRFYAWLGERCPGITRRYDPQALVQHRHGFFAGFPDERHDLTGLRKRWLAHLFETHGVDAVCPEEAFRVFWEHRNAVTLFEDAERVLSDLRPRYRVGVITNGNACVDFIGIGHYFDFVVSSERAGRSKPEPEIFQLALADAGADAREAVHVGDDPTNDVRGAAAVGMRTVWYNPSGKPWPEGPAPDATIASLADLDGALRALGAG